MNRVIIAGSRTFNDYELLKRTCDVIFSNFTGVVMAVVSGGAKGADSLGERYAQERGLKILSHLPDWQKHGRSAGIIRNKEMADNAEGLIAFWDGKSRGTFQMIDYAKRKGLMVHTVMVG